LISVNETPVGGEASPYHMDGIKYLDQVSSEDFQASIEAYTYPDEFALLDGSLELAPGLFAKLQPRRAQFGLSYRTGLGNDLEGVNFGYTLHLIYNAIAEATSKAHKSRGADIDPEPFTWTINAVPPDALNYKPTAHFEIDSTKVDPMILALVEQRLYGVETNVPYLPPQDFIIEMMNATSVTLNGGTPSSSGLSMRGGTPNSFSTNSYEAGTPSTEAGQDYSYS
jgi:hypothetical protein